MSVKIRLRRTGRKKQPSYRLVATNSTAPRDGEYLEALGTYNPLVKPADLRIDMEKVEKWLADGAEMSDTAASLIRKARRGGDKSLTVRPVEPDAPKEKVESVVAAKEPSRSRAGSRGAPRAGAAEDASVGAKAPEAAVDADAGGPRGAHVEPQDPAVERGESAEGDADPAV